VAIQPEEVRRIAALARLEVREEDLARVAAELSAVLDYAAVLQRLDLAGCEPASLTPAEGGLREDGPDGRQLAREQALAAAPAVEGDCFAVPPVVENLEP
jgi:aspartyl-tRNA(Asn)/glutamyl-tRNA(Gln) amidotransferase subunit C